MFVPQGKQRPQDSKFYYIFT